MFRFRARAIKGVKHNTKGSHANLDCRLCLGPPETQEHLQECHGAGFERRGLELEREVDLITFWRRIFICKAARLRPINLVVTFDLPIPVFLS